MADQANRDSPLLNREILAKLQRELNQLLTEAGDILQLQGIASSDPRGELALVVQAVTHGVNKQEARLFQGSRSNFAHFVKGLIEFRKQVTRRIGSLSREKQLTTQHIDRVFAAVQYGVPDEKLGSLSPDGLVRLRSLVQTMIDWISDNLRTQGGKQIQQAGQDDVDSAYYACLRHAWEHTQKPTQRAFLLIEIVALLTMASHGLVYQYYPYAGIIFLTVGILVNGLFIFLRRNLVM